MNMIVYKISFIHDSPISIIVCNDFNDEDLVWMKMLQTLNEFKNIHNVALTLEQDTIYKMLMTMVSRLHIFSGLLGSGKTFLIWYLAYKLISDNKVILIATSMEATATIHSVVTTAHYQLKVPIHNYQYPLSIFETNECYFKINEVDVIIIDEIYMLTRMIFDIVIDKL